MLEVAATNVDVDLNGRTLQSANANFSTVIGVSIFGGGIAGNVRVHNGTLARGGVPQGVRGVAVLNPMYDGVILDGLRFIGCGFSVTSQDPAPVNAMVVRGCVFIESAVAVQINTGGGELIQDCFVQRCGSAFELGPLTLIERCVIGGHGNSTNGAIRCGDSSVVEGNSILRALTGVRAGAKCVVSGNTIEGGAGATNGVLLDGAGNRVSKNSVTGFGTGVQSGAGSQVVINNTFYQVETGVNVGAPTSLVGTPITAAKMATEANPYANMYV